MPRKSTRNAQVGGTIRQCSDGRWEARYTVGRDPGTGKQIQRSVYGSTQKEVRQKLAQITAAIDSGTYKEPCKMTLGQWLDIWQRDYLGGVKPSTAFLYGEQIRLHIRPALGSVRLEALNTHTIQGFYNTLGRERGEKPGLSPKSIKNIHGVLHKALQQAVAIGYLRFNPTDSCTLPRAEHKEICPLDEEQISAFLKTIEGHRHELLYIAIRKLALAGRSTDPVTVVDAMQGGDKYVGWIQDAMTLTPTSANVEEYIKITREKAMLYRFRELCDRGKDCLDIETAAELARKISSTLSATDRMPRMTGPELANDFLRRMRCKEKPKYLPWGIPTADRATYAELGDMILLGGYASSGKTLLSILMAIAQAKAGCKVGYYSLETKPEKMADRMFASLAKVPLGRIKTRDFTENEWSRFAEAANCVATACPFDIIRAAGSTVDDIVADAVGHGYQVIYVDYVQLVQVPGVRSSDRYAQVTAASQGLKTFAQSSKTAVVALAQLSRPDRKGKGGKYIPPSMHSFRESVQLEQDADVAFLIYPSDPDDNTSNRVFKIGKNKEGPRPRIELAFRGDIQTMVELEPEPDHSIAARLNARGRAIKQANRAQARQVEFRELRDGDADAENPFA